MEFYFLRNKIKCRQDNALKRKTKKIHFIFEQTKVADVMSKLL